MSARLWIEESTDEKDEQTTALAILLAEVVKYRRDVEKELETITQIDVADIYWDEQFQARAFWTGYVLDLRRKGLLRYVVEHMATRFPPRREDFEYYLKLKVAKRGTAWYEPPDPLDAMFVGPGTSQPMINRSKLRAELRKLSKEGFRTLNITGGSASGKTYSYQLLQVLSRAEGFPMLLVDVAEWGTERFGALELAQRLAGHFKFAISAEVVADVPDPHTRARLLMNELRDNFPPVRNPRWIVIDGLDRANVDPDARGLVEKLLRSVDVNAELGEVKLVVTGFDGLVPPKTRKEPISPITRPDVRQLFAVAAAHLGYPATDAELDSWTAQVWDGSDPAADEFALAGETIYGIARETICSLTGQSA
ncbi:hypothetical protein EV651_101321 [Kribbella sp. VKM Ac-2571]|uniref:hypothetical protein n=1 Tax=Kribbella sp. VKM Ac-2571 TaxID=2512222 RepID=UPI00105CE407|nr:hypothetical protein [Kribbella sp. VKM Ac-2571]TDO69281.1 hypothetical protein EV651_101321 [Kribbella sp. VKM Ac-2571]